MQAERFVVLSEVRAEVLRLSVSGIGAAEIAERLKISRKRVYEHLQALRNAGFLEK
jgi:DNA-binding CsgD family transcriptional regulator